MIDIAGPKSTIYYLFLVLLFISLFLLFIFFYV